MAIARLFICSIVSFLLLCGIIVGLQISPLYAIEKIDSDHDGLSDYEEINKYKTNPLSEDSDSDGIVDGDWEERREYSYTVQAICRIKKPCNLDDMDDFFQDVRIIEKHEHYTIVEMLIFPFVKHQINPQKYPCEPNALFHEYIKPTFEMNYSPEMNNSISELTINSMSDIDAITRILDWLKTNTELKRYPPHWEFFNILDNTIMWHNSSIHKQRFLDDNFFADSMFKKKVHGTCSSLAILRGGMLRAAGIPTRLIQTYPLIARYINDEEPLCEQLRLRSLAHGYDWGPGRGGANHMYNEVHIGGRWIRVDGLINVGPLVNNKIFVKVYSLNSFNNFKVSEKVEDGWNEKRCFRALKVSDQFPKYHGKILIKIVKLELLNEQNNKYKTRLTIVNNGNILSGHYVSKFYCVDTLSNTKRLVSRGFVGPLAPFLEWRERTSAFSFLPNEDTLQVIVSPVNNNTEDIDVNDVFLMSIPAPSH